MKTITSTLFFIMLFFSCSKNSDNTSENNNNNNNNTVIASDTLTTGWTKTTLPVGFGDIYFTDNNTGYASTDKIYKTTDGGNNWNVISNNLYGYNTSGSPDGKIFMCGPGNNVYYSTNAGASFDTGVIYNGIRDCFFPDNNNGFAIGTNFFKTVDGGVTWNIVMPITGIIPASGYRSLFFINSNTGWIISYTDIFRCTGSINNWVAANFNVPASDFFTAIYATGPDIVYAVTRTGQVYKSIDGGVNFTLLTTFVAANSFADIHFVNADTGYVSIDKKIYRTTDGGNTWQTVVSLGTGVLSEVHFTDANHGWACASDSIAPNSYTGIVLSYRP